MDDEGRAIPLEPEQCGYNRQVDAGRWESDRDRDQDCKLGKGHDGLHDPGANWRGRLEIQPAYGGGLSIEIRHDHGYGSLKIGSMEQAEEVARAILGAATDVFA
jgi:hypothetical protein